METTADNSRRYGMTMERERGGHEGGWGFLIPRRDRDFERGILSEEGRARGYFVFRPSNVFVRTLGDQALRLNQALLSFEGQAANHALFHDAEKITAHYAELANRIEAARDRLFVLIGSCNQVRDGLSKDVLEGIDWPAAEGSGTEPENGPDWVVSDMDDADIFDAVRERNVEEGILTGSGREMGYVAFQPCSFYGRFLGEIVYVLNDALRRMERRTAVYIAAGSAELVRQYYERLTREMALLRTDVEEIVGFCRSKIV